MEQRNEKDQVEMKKNEKNEGETKWSKGGIKRIKSSWEWNKNERNEGSVKERKRRSGNKKNERNEEKIKNNGKNEGREE
uniref:Uncharacterized protein n=1 Tax=Rhizophagus irregularis (strain DAOM 181602 / DAOM 197198 / MUCL 43194) TaxID=747089 RepID=U9TBS7_RHIID